MNLLPAPEMVTGSLPMLMAFAPMSSVPVFVTKVPPFVVPSAVLVPSFNVPCVIVAAPLNVLLDASASTARSRATPRP